MARHAAEGVTFRCGRGVLPSEADELRLDDGTWLPADLVIVAIGVVPEVDLAQDAGLAVDDGIVVDAALRTNDPRIFAAGDCASVDHQAYGRMRSQAWQDAREQGEAAAANLMREPTPFAAVPWFWSDQYDLGVQCAGAPGRGVREVQRDGAAGIHFSIAEDGTLAGATGIGNAVAKDIRVALLLVAVGMKVSPKALADPGVNLKRVLRA